MSASLNLLFGLTSYIVPQGRQAAPNAPISSTAAALKDQLVHLKPKGQTALVPALMVAIGMASSGTPCSQIVLCTDGLSNIGVGSLEVGSTSQSAGLTEEEAFTQKFYIEAAVHARNAGLCVNIVSFEGEHCNLQALGGES